MIELHKEEKVAAVIAATIVGIIFFLTNGPAAMKFCYIEIFINKTDVFEMLIFVVLFVLYFVAFWVTLTTLLLTGYNYFRYNEDDE